MNGNTDRGNDEPYYVKVAIIFFDHGANMDILEEQREQEKKKKLFAIKNPFCDKIIHIFYVSQEGYDVGQIGAKKFFHAVSYTQFFIIIECL